MRNGLSKDKVVKVLLRDKNDNVPKFKLDKFIGQVEEEKKVEELNEKPLVTVEAVDKDKETPAFRDVRRIFYIFLFQMGKNICWIF